MPDTAKEITVIGILINKFASCYQFYERSARWQENEAGGDIPNFHTDGEL